MKTKAKLLAESVFDFQVSVDTDIVEQNRAKVVKLKSKNGFVFMVCIFGYL